MGLKRFLLNLFYGDTVTPLPHVVMAVLFVVMLCNAMTMTMVFSFLPKFVKSFGTSEVNTGYYAGLIASSLFVGRTIFSLLWGYLADVKGKKTTLLMSATGLMLSTLAFAFSTGFYWALITRFIQGSFMGLVAVSKSILVDLCDDTNVAIGMSLLISSFSAGLIIGPSVAGFLVFPAEQYPNVFKKDSLFGRFGISPPNLVIVFGMAISLVFIVIYIPTDKRKATGEKAHLISSPEHNKEYVTPVHHGDDYCNYSIDKTSQNTKAKMYNKHSYTFLLIEPIDDAIPTSGCCQNFFSIKGFKKTKMWELFRIKKCVISSILYGTYSIAAVGFDEMFPLYAATSKLYNGFGFTTRQIGVALLAMAIFIPIFQVVVISKLTRRFGPRKVFIGSTLAMAFSIPLVPSLVPISNNIVFWFLLVVILLFTRVAVSGAFLAVNILLNNSVTSELLGSANGLGMTLSSAGRTIAPSLFGSMYSWSLENTKDVEGNDEALGFPFNQYFPFFMLSLVSILNAFFASQLSASMDHKKTVIEEEAKDYDSVDIDNNLMKTTRLTVSAFRPE